MTVELAIAGFFAVLFAGLSKGGFGGSFVVLAVPTLSLATDPVTAAAILLPVLCFIDLMSLWKYRKHASWYHLRILLGASIIGIIIGTLVYGQINKAWVQLLIGFIAISFTLYRWFGAQMMKQLQEKRPGTAAGWLWGSIAGFTSFVAHAGGPPLSIYLLPQNLDRTRYQATTVIVFATANYIKLIPYYSLGLLNTDNISISLYLIPAAILGVGLGIFLHKRVSDVFFFRLCYIGLFCMGIKLIVDGITNL